MTVQITLPPQVEAMIQELQKIGVHGGTISAVIETLVLDQLKYLCGQPGFRTMVDVAYDAARAQETKRRSMKPLGGCTCDVKDLENMRDRGGEGNPSCPLHGRKAEQA